MTRKQTSTRAAIPTDPRKLLAHLEWAEVDPARAPDCRRVLRREREALALALRSGDARRIGEARDEAVRTVCMWEGY